MSEELFGCSCPPQRSSRHCVCLGQTWWCVMKDIASRMTTLTSPRPSRRSIPGHCVYIVCTVAEWEVHAI